MDMFPGIIIALIVGVAIVAIVINTVATKKRTEAWKQAAADLGLPFRGKDNDVLTRFGHLKTFKQGHSRRVTNAIVGNTGEMEIAVADYEYTDGGENSCTHHQTICILRSQGLRLPHCFLRPEGRLFDFLGGLLGGQDFDFNEDPAFSSAYVLQGVDEPAIRDLFDAETRQWFAARQQEKFHFEADNDMLLFHTGRKVKPQETRRLMEEAIEIKSVLESRGERV